MMLYGFRNVLTYLITPGSNPMCDPSGGPPVSVGLRLGPAGTSAPTPVPSSLLGEGGPGIQPH